MLPSMSTALLVSLLGCALSQSLAQTRIQERPHDPHDHSHDPHDHSHDPHDHSHDSLQLPTSIQTSFSKWNYANQGALWADQECKGLHERQSPIDLPSRAELANRINDPNSRFNETEDGLRWSGPPKTFTYNYDASETNQGYVIGQGGFGIAGESSLEAVPSLQSQLFGKLWLDGTEYDAIDIHFHVAEHTVKEGLFGSYRHPLELHIVHRRSEQHQPKGIQMNPNAFVVLGIWFQTTMFDTARPTNGNEFLFNFTRGVTGFAPLMEHQKAYRPDTTLSLNSLLQPGPSNKPLMPNFDNILFEEDSSPLFAFSDDIPEIHAYSYEGSLTTPPCTEAVQWIILAKPVRASAVEINSLRYLLRVPSGYENYRLTQNQFNKSPLAITPLIGKYNTTASSPITNLPAEQTGTNPPITTLPENPTNPPITTLPENPTNPPITTLPQNPTNPPITTLPQNPTRPPVTNPPDITTSNNLPSTIGSNPLDKDNTSINTPPETPPENLPETRQLRSARRK